MTENPYDLQGKRVRFRGKSARIVKYLGENRFDVLDSTDTVYAVHRDRLAFCK